MMTPPSDGESVTNVQFSDVVLQRVDVLAFNSSRVSSSAMLFLCLDMVYRGLIGTRFTKNDVNNLELFSDLASRLSNDLSTLAREVITVSPKGNKASIFIKLKKMADIINRQLASILSDKL